MNNYTKLMFIGGIAIIITEILYIALYVNEERKRVKYLGRKKGGDS